MKKILHNQKGLTLIELILYVALASALLFSMSIFMSVMLEARVKNQVMAEVEGQGLQTMDLITQTIRNASGINSPAQGVTDSTLSLVNYSIPLDPTVFNLSGGAIRITEGSGSAVPLTNTKVTASAVTFSNLSRTGTPGTVRVQFTLTYNNTLGRNEFNYSKTFIDTATLRQP